MTAKPSPSALIREMKKLGSPEAAVRAQRFFKTGKGEYSEGDKFLGISMPVLRARAARLREHDLAAIETLLHNEFHDIRLLALLALVEQYQRGDGKKQTQVVRCYLANTRWINNWDLVDCCAYKILGPYLQNRDRKLLFRLARSKDLWERRIAIMSSFHFMRFSSTPDVSTTLELAEILVNDDEDLIHKAVGWMLREAWQFNTRETEKFLKRHYAVMPRTMLRYAIEKIPERQRKAWLQGKT